MSPMSSNKKHKILFVCLGNICRSPAAEGIMKAMVEKRGVAGDFIIDSAGVGSWHVGQLPDSRMRRQGRQHGYDFSSRARQIEAADFDRFDVIAVMDRENYHDVAAKAPSAEGRQKIVSLAGYLARHPQYTTIPDPYYGDERDFETVIELLEDALAGFLDSLTQ